MFILLFMALTTRMMFPPKIHLVLPSASLSGDGNILTKFFGNFVRMCLAHFVSLKIKTNTELLWINQEICCHDSAVRGVFNVQMLFFILPNSFLSRRNFVRKLIELMIFTSK